jgi:hypothetical protein
MGCTGGVDLRVCHRRCGDRVPHAQSWMEVCVLSLSVMPSEGQLLSTLQTACTRCFDGLLVLLRFSFLATMHCLPAPR